MLFVPVLAGSAFKNKGVQPLLNAVIELSSRTAGRSRLYRIRRRATRPKPEYRAPGRRRPAVFRPCIQGDERSVRRLADLYPDLFGAIRKGDQMLNSTKDGATRRTNGDDAFKQPGGNRRGVRRGHHRACGTQGNDDRGTRSAAPRSRWFLKPWRSRTP